MALKDSATYTASSAGTVRNVYVQNGDRVKKGDRLVRLSNGTLCTADFDGTVNMVSVKAGDEVVCFGRCGRDAITPDDWAAIKGTHAYDIICSLGSRVQRVVSAGSA